MTYSPDLTMKSALPDVMAGFEAVMAGPDRIAWEPKQRFRNAGMSLAEDTFGEFGLAAGDEFMRVAFEVAGPKNMQILKGCEMARLAGCITSLYAEMTVITCLEDKRSSDWRPEQVAQIARNGYEAFHEVMIKSGRKAGSGIVDDYLVPSGVIESSLASHFPGTVIDGELKRPGRLGKFKLEYETGEPEAGRIIPVGLEASLEERVSKATNPADRRVNCSAHIYKAPEGGDTYAKRFFNAMVGHAERHIYPSYIPVARMALAAHHAAAEDRAALAA